jgi:hypothetical protein
VGIALKRECDHRGFEYARAIVEERRFNAA